MNKLHVAAEHLAVDFFQVFTQVALALAEGQTEQTHEKMERSLPLRGFTASACSTSNSSNSSRLTLTSGLA